MRVGIVQPIREGQEYLREWVIHHLKLGFDKIIIIDNNETNGPNPMDQVIDLQQFIEYIDIRGNHDKDRQNKTNTLAYQKFHKEFDWLFFFDSDEYIFLNQDNNIKDYLSRPEFKHADVIGINWRLMSDNDLIYKDPRPVIERFTEFCPNNCKTVYNTVPQNFHIKSAVRCTRDDIWFNHPHFPRANRPLNTVNGSGRPIKSLCPFCEYDFTLIELRHYQTKSTQEFCENRLIDSNRYVNGARYDGVVFDNSKEIAGYFKMNKWSPEKQEYIDNYCKEHGLKSYTPCV